MPRQQPLYVIENLNNDFWDGALWVKEYPDAMTWDNYGKKHGWALDHVISLVKFDLTDREQFLIANHYGNIQALWRDDNSKKNDRLDWSPTESIHELPKRLKIEPVREG